MATHPPAAKLSFDEYLGREQNAPYKSEYRAGEVFAMAGDTDLHAAVAAQIIYLLKRETAGRCRLYTSDLKLYVPSVQEGMYPDAMLICGHPEYYKERRDVVLNPTVIVEVFSPSTEQYDLSIKAEFYRQIPSLKFLLLMASERVYAQCQTRRPPVGPDARTSWKLEEITNRDMVLSLGDLSTLVLDEIYEGIVPGRLAASSPRSKSGKSA